MHRPAVTPAPAADTLAYVRVSTEDQARGEKTSLADQRAAVGALARSRGRQLEPRMVFEDAGASGANAEGRPAFMALVAYCESHPRSPNAMGEVLVLNDSRWGRFRDPDEATYWRVHLAKSGWRVRFAEGDETDDPLARGVLRAVHSATSSAYRESIRANAQRGARGAAAKGLWQNEAPLGYRRLATRAGETTGRVLEPGQRKADDETVRLTPGPADEQAIVRWAFARYASGEVSLGILMRELAVRCPSRAWSRQTLRAVLRNPTYLGRVVWCRRPHDELERRATWIRPASAWVVAEHAHEALIPPTLFARVQEILARNLKQTRATVGGYPLSGLLRCSVCGRPYIGGGGRVAPGPDRDRYRFYKCSGGDKRVKVCPPPAKTISKRMIEARVIALVADVVGQPGVQRLIAAEVRRQVGQRAESAGAERQRLERDRRQLTAAQDRLAGAVARGVLAEAEAASQMARIRADLAATMAAIEANLFDTRRTEAVRSEEVRLVRLAADFPRVVAAASGPQVRELLRPWIADAVVDHANRKVVLTIRRVPLAGALVVSRGQPGRTARKRADALTVRRTIRLPRAPKGRAR